jgi:hypothetical protein
MVDEAEEDWAKRNGDNAGQDAICVWHGRTGHFADWPAPGLNDTRLS